MDDEKGLSDNLSGNMNDEKVFLMVLEVFRNIKKIIREVSRMIQYITNEEYYLHILQKGSKDIHSLCICIFGSPLVKSPCFNLIL